MAIADMAQLMAHDRNDLVAVEQAYQIRSDEKIAAEREGTNHGGGGHPAFEGGPEHNLPVADSLLPAEFNNGMAQR